MEGRNDGIDEIKYGPDAPFWRTSMSQAIAVFGVIRPSFENPPLNEESYKRIQESVSCARNFQERMDRVLDTPIPHKEPMSALLPRLSDAWPSGYSPLAENFAPIDDVPPRGMYPRNPGQTSNPTVVNPRFVSSPPINFVAGGKSSAQMVVVHSNTGGKPLA